MFKVGDTVKNVGRDSGKAPIGYIGKITEIDPDGDIWIDNKACRKPRELELVGESSAELVELSSRVLVALASNPSTEGTPEQFAQRAVEAARALLAECSKP